MSVNTAVTPQEGAMAIGPKVQVAQITVDIGVTGTLASGDAFEIFTGEAGDVIVGGALTVITAGTASCDIDIGVAEDGATIVADAQADATAGTVVAAAAANTTNVVLGTDSVYFTNQAAPATAMAAGKYLVTLMILKAGDFAG